MKHSKGYPLLNQKLLMSEACTYRIPKQGLRTSTLDPGSQQAVGMLSPKGSLILGSMPKSHVLPEKAGSSEH